MYISIIISHWAHIFSVSIINHMPGLGVSLAGVCSVLSPLSYISSCCFLRGHWFRHTRGCGIDPQSSAPVSRPISSAALDLTLWRHNPCRVTSDPVISSHKRQTLTIAFSLVHPRPYLSLSVSLPSFLCLSVSVQFWMILRKCVCMLILTWMMSTWCNDNLISDAQHKKTDDELDTNTTNDKHVDLATCWISSKHWWLMLLILYILFEMVLQFLDIFFFVCLLF